MGIAWPLIVAACGGFLPLPPSTTRSVESGWGEPVDGLSILLAADAASVPLGGKLPVEVFFRYSPFLAGRTGVSLVHDESTERWALVLRDARTGETWERPPYDAGMPIFPDRTPLPLGYGPAGERSDTYFLLSEDGEQVPPGDYDVTVRTTNDGSPGQRAVPDPAHPLWRGTVETAPLRMRVLPRSADTTRCEIPTAVALTRDGRGALQWTWAPDSWEAAGIVSRPGYHLGCSMDFRWFLGAEPFPSPPPDASRKERDDFRDVWGLRTVGVRGGPLPGREHPPVGGGARIGGPRFREVLQQGNPVRVVVRARIFETSVPAGHAWSPESGDYRVLREWEATGTYTAAP